MKLQRAIGALPTRRQNSPIGKKRMKNILFALAGLDQHHTKEIIRTVRLLPAIFSRHAFCAEAQGGRGEWGARRGEVFRARSSSESVHGVAGGRRDFRLTDVAGEVVKPIVA